MQKTIQFIASLLILAFSLSSCIDIKEEVTITKKGSGNYKMVVDWSQLQELMETMEGIASEDEQSGQPKPSIINSMMEETGSNPFSEIVQLANGISGLSNGKAIIDTTKNQTGFSIDFDNIDALNEFLMMTDQENMSQEAVFAYSKGKFEHRKLSPLVLSFSEGLVESMNSDDKADEEGSESDKIGQMMFSSASYQFKLNTPKKIRGFSNKAAKQTAKKTIEFNLSFKDVFEQDGKPKSDISVKNTIDF